MNSLPVYSHVALRHCGEHAESASELVLTLRGDDLAQSLNKDIRNEEWSHCTYCLVLKEYIKIQMLPCKVQGLNFASLIFNQVHTYLVLGLHVTPKPGRTRALKFAQLAASWPSMG